MHTLGLGVLVGASTVIDLRLLGAASRIPLEPLRRLFPIMWAGFWVNAISGVALFAADATTKGTTTVFLSKLVIIVLAVVVLMSIKRIVYGHRTRSGEDHSDGPRPGGGLAGALAGGHRHRTVHGVRVATCSRGPHDDHDSRRVCGVASGD